MDFIFWLVVMLVATCWPERVSGWSVVSEVAVPSVIVVNLSIDGYFLPPGVMETEQHLLDFLDGILDGSIEVSLNFDGDSDDVLTNMNPCVCFISQIQGGNSVHQRIGRFCYDVKVTLTVSPAIVSLTVFLSQWCDLSLHLHPSSQSSARLHFWAAVWSVSHLLLPPSCATSAVGLRPPWRMTTIHHCSVEERCPTKSLINIKIFNRTKSRRGRWFITTGPPASSKNKNSPNIKKGQKRPITVTWKVLSENVSVSRLRLTKFYNWFSSWPAEETIVRDILTNFNRFWFRF